MLYHPEYGMHTDMQELMNFTTDLHLCALKYFNVNKFIINIKVRRSE